MAKAMFEMQKVFQTKMQLQVNLGIKKMARKGHEGGGIMGKAKEKDFRTGWDGFHYEVEEQPRKDVKFVIMQQMENVVQPISTKL